MSKFLAPIIPNQLQELIQKLEKLSQTTADNLNQKIAKLSQNVAEKLLGDLNQRMNNVEQRIEELQQKIIELCREKMKGPRIKIEILNQKVRAVQG